MMFHLWRGDFREEPTRKKYPIQCDIDGADALAAACYDHACACYRGNERCNANFLWADVLAMDCDNEQGEPFMEPGDVAAAFPGVAFYVVYSRNHQKTKHAGEDREQGPRPRFHAYFPLRQRVEDAGTLKRMKEHCLSIFPAFDGKAKDAARFFFGAENARAEYHDGKICLDEFLAAWMPETPVDQEPAPTAREPKRQGQDISDLDRIPAMLEKIPCGELEYDEWIKIGMIIREAGGDFALWDAWSSTDTQGRYKAREMRAKWDSFKGAANPVAMGTLHDIAKRFGYSEREYRRERRVLENGVSAAAAKKSLRPDELTDIDAARVFARTFAKKIVYVPLKGLGFHVYDGTRWRQDSQQARARRMAHTLADAQLKEAKDLYRNANEAHMRMQEAMDASDDEKDGAKKALAAAKKYFCWAIDQRGKSRIGALLTEAAAEVDLAEADSFDRDGMLLNTPAGTVDLRTGMMREHRAADFLTKITGVPPSTDGAAMFREFIMRITDGDMELAAYLQKVAGMFCTGQILTEALVIAYGPGGNGKSTFFSLLSRVLGEYSCTISADVMIQDRFGNSQKQPEIAKLRGVRLAVAGELEEGQRLSVATLKKICSTDEITAAKKFENSITFWPSHHTCLHTNFLPKITARDRGTWDRILLLPFDHADMRNTNEEIKNYADVLFRECGGAVLQWMIDGARMYLDAGGKIQRPQAVLDAIAQYRGDSDWLAQFIADCCDVGMGRQKMGKLYQRYRQYCEDTGEQPCHNSQFSRQLQAAGYGIARRGDGVYVSGLALKNQSIEKKHLHLV